MRTGKEYLESLADGRRVVIGGEVIANVATHPKTRDYAQRVADFYDLHHRPELADVMTFVDDLGTRRMRMWHLPRDKEDLIQRRRYHETVVRLVGFGQFGRTPDVNNLTQLTYIDDPEPWVKNSVDTEGKVTADNIQRFWRLCMENDLNVTPAVIDAQPDRSRPEAYLESPDLTVVDRDDRGIVINGVKAIVTGGAFANHLMVGTFWRPGMPVDKIIYLHLAPNTPGVTMVCREPLQKTNHTGDHPLACLGDELENYLHFDHIFVPWENVLHLGNPDHARLYPQRLFDWIHYQDLLRQTVKAELLVGLAILMCENIGTINIPAVQMRLSDLVRFWEACRAHLLAAEDSGFRTPSGMWKANNLFFDFGRGYFMERYPWAVQELLDLAGRGVVLSPMEADWQSPDLRTWLEPLVRGPRAVDERLRILRVIRDLFLTDWGRRNAMFDNFNGTPLTTMRMLTMQRTEYQPGGPLTALAREACGLPLGEGQTTQAETVAAYARAQDVRTI